MLKTETTVIDGEEYTLSQLPAMRSLKLFSKLAGILGPALAKAGGLAGTDGSADLGALAELVGMLAAKLPGEELEAITNDLLWNLRRGTLDVAPKKGFDLAFAGKATTVFKLLRWAFEVNYGDFFAAGRDLIAQAQTRPAQSSSKALST